MTGRTLLRAATAVALLAAIAVAFLLWRRDGGATARETGSLAEGPARAPAPPERAAVASAAAVAVPVPPDARPWSEVRLATREADLGPGLARDVYDGLRRARQALSPCFDAAARDEARRPTPQPTEGDQMGPPILTLQLEARDGELVIVGAPLQQLGGGTAELVACCEELLRGFRIAARNAAAGGRYRLQYELLF